MRVLLVGDNYKLAVVAVDAMRSYGFTVDRVATAYDAEEAAANVDYEAIILDLGLPDHDGLPLRHMTRPTPLLALTARDA